MQRFVIILLLCCLCMTACGKKPRVIVAPNNGDGAYAYPAVEAIPSKGAQ